MKHVMIDLETLGSTPGSAILSIGAVYFDPESSTLGNEFYATVGLESCLDYELKVEAPTFYWWMKQDDAARLALCGESHSLVSALGELGRFIRDSMQERCLVWAHGPSFDLAILSVAYSQTFMTKPWAYRDERDTRTLLDLAGMEMGKPEGAHHALVDARHQAGQVMDALRILNHVDF